MVESNRSASPCREQMLISETHSESLSAKVVSAFFPFRDSFFERSNPKGRTFEPWRAFASPHRLCSGIRGKDRRFFPVPMHDHAPGIRNAGNNGCFKVFAVCKCKEFFAVLRRNNNRHAFLRFAYRKLRAVKPGIFFGTLSSSISSPSASSPIATETPPAPKSLQHFINVEASGFRNSLCSLRSSGALPFEPPLRMFQVMICCVTCLSPLHRRSRRVPFFRREG